MEKEDAYSYLNKEGLRAASIAYACAACGNHPLRQTRSLPHRAVG